MKVADLQQHLADLKGLLERAGVRGAVLTDLDAIGKGLAPFRERPLREFADFLVRAEAYSRGEVPPQAPKGRGRSPAAGKDKAPAPDAAALAQEARRLYDQATDPAVTTEVVRGLAARLGKLTADGLRTVAEAVELKVAKSAKKAAILEGIERRILDRKGSWERAGLLDRPTTLGPPAAEPARGPNPVASPATALP
jgi:hypothetical protein